MFTSDPHTPFGRAQRLMHARTCLGLARRHIFGASEFPQGSALHKSALVVARAYIDEARAVARPYLGKVRA